MRAILNRETKVRSYWEDEDGALVAPDAAPTFVVTDGAGATVSTGTATLDEVDGIAWYVLPAQTRCDELTITFTGSVNSLQRVVAVPVSVVGDRLVDLWRYRQDSELALLDGPTLREVAEAVEDWFEIALGYPVVERSLRTTWEYMGGTIMRPPGVKFPRHLYALSTNGLAYQDSELAQITAVRNAWQWISTGTVDIVYGSGQPQFRLGGLSTVWCTHGPPNSWAATPVNLARAAVVLARYTARATNYPERAGQIATEGALITFSMPNPDKPTGLPEVDAVVTKYRVLEVV